MDSALPENELKMLMACNGLVKKKKPLSFALGPAGSGVLLVLRPRKKDPKGALVKSAFKKALKSMKVAGKLATFGEAVWEDGKVVFHGERGFPSGAKKKIREFATEHKLKNFVKVVCQLRDGAEELPDDEKGEEPEESEVEAAAAEQRALAALERAAPPIIEDEDALESLVEELLQQERAELAEEISQLKSAVASAAPPAVAARGFRKKIEQIRSFGAPEGMLPATLEVYIELCEDLLTELPTDHPERNEIDGLLRAANAAHGESAAVLTAAQEKAWSTLQSSVHYTTMQLPALQAYLRSSDDEILRQIGGGDEIPKTTRFLAGFQDALVALGRAASPEQAQAALATLRPALTSYAAAKSTERFQVLSDANPFPVPLPLMTLGDQAQSLLDTF